MSDLERRKAWDDDDFPSLEAIAQAMIGDCLSQVAGDYSALHAAVDDRLTVIEPLMAICDEAEAAHEAIEKHRQIVLL
jgi:hypothetical protein